MHTEHLRNVHPVRVLGGWLVSVALTSVAVFGLIALGLLGPGPGDTVWAVVGVGVGFFLGGIFTGTRTVEAPILHGVGLGLTSLVAWVGLNLVVVGFGGGGWSGLETATAMAVLLVQIVMAVLGCWVGTQQARARAGTPPPPDRPLEAPEAE